MTLSTFEPDALLFETVVFFNPNHFTLIDVVPASGLGQTRMEIDEVSQGRSRILYQAERPLLGNGGDEKIFDLELLINETLPPGIYPVASGGSYKFE